MDRLCYLHSQSEGGRPGQLYVRLDNRTAGCLISNDIEPEEGDPAYMISFAGVTLMDAWFLTPLMR
jgi:hypothetical protein